MVTPDLPLYHVGPPLDFGPLPTIFYFALSGPDTLTVDPYNQPVQFLQGKAVRIFSMTLPGHDEGPKEAMAYWAQNPSCIEAFLASAKQALLFTIENGFADPAKLGVMGLSRGGFIAAHVAAEQPQVRALLGFAPITRLGALPEFASCPQSHLDLIHLTPLAKKHVRLYIGNADTRVGTRDCVDFALHLAAQKRSAQVELFITPSIGHMGHGTAPEIFQQGSEWLYSICS